MTTTRATHLVTRAPTTAFVPSPFFPFTTTNQSIPRTGQGDNIGVTGPLTSTMKMKMKKRGAATIVRVPPFPVDQWSPSVDSRSFSSQLFAFSLFPYLGFLYFITRSRTAPPLTLFGFYFLLAFVGATKSFLTLTNVFIVLGLRRALRRAKDEKECRADASQDVKKSCV